MKKLRRLKNCLVILFVLFIGITNLYAAGTATVGFTGSNSVAKDSNITIRLSVSNIVGTHGGIVSMGGYLTFDSTYLSYVSGTGITSPYTFQINRTNNKIAGLDNTLENGITNTTSVFTFVFKALKTGSTTISFTNGKLTDDSGVVTGTYNSKTISITDPLSSNNNLSSLRVNEHSIKPAFQSSVTSYSLTVPNSTSSIIVTAVAEETTATVTGTGTKNLAVGNNNIPIVVTAANGAKKTYTLTVKREAGASSNTSTTEVKSSDNYIKSLNIKNAELNPGFDKAINTYSVTIPADTQKLDIDYVLNNTKSKIVITGNENFSSDKANIVTIEVTAEDGSKRVYNINVIKSAKKSDNKLKELIIDNGTLKPPFNSDIFEYDIDVDKEIEDIDIKATSANDKAKIEVTGNTNLKEGNNVILIKVTDENGFVQYYKINVEKEKSDGFSLFGLSLSQSILIASLAIMGFLGILILIIVALYRKNNEIPTIEIKPEFNFNSNNSDDDTIYGNEVHGNDYANIKQPRKVIELEEPEYEEKEELEDTKQIELVDHSSDLDDLVTHNVDSYEEEQEEPVIARHASIEEDVRQVEQDSIFDDVVTTDELIDAIKEKDAKKLKLLFKQEILNREKEELKKELVRKRVQKRKATTVSRTTRSGRNRSYVFLVFILILLSFTKVNATTAKYSTDSTELTVGSTKKLVFSVKDIDGVIASAGGTIAVNDSSCIEITNIKSLNSNVMIPGRRFAYIDPTLEGLSSNTDFLEITVKGLDVCEGKIIISDPAISDNESKGTVILDIGTIKVVSEKSDNNYLKSITISEGKLSPSFSKNVDEYNVTVKSSISSLVIGCEKDNNKSVISGDGKHTLSYGKNTFVITVKAENGNIKKYKIYVTRNDERSSDAKLNNITVSEGTLSPSFSSSKNDYSLTVPYEVQSVSIQTSKSNAKAAVSVYGNDNLIAGETRKVIVKVTAENGTSNNYNISVTRLNKDNNTQTSDNTLKELTPSVGILSPEFNPNITEYVVWVPFEIENIDFKTTPTNSKSTVQEEKCERLIVNDNNIFKYTVSSGADDIKEYKIIVKRGYSVDMLSSSNTNLSILEMRNGDLLEKFDKNKYDYEYVKYKDVSLVYKPENSSSKAYEIRHDDKIYIVVQALNGDTQVYSFTLANNNFYIYYIITIVALISIIILLAIKYKKKSKQLKITKLFKK